MAWNLALRSLYEAAKETAEDELVKRPERVPVNQACEPYRIEQRSLPDEASGPLAGHLELKPGASWKTHFSRES